MEDVLWSSWIDMSDVQKIDVDLHKRMNAAWENGETITYNVEHVNDDDFVIDFMVSTTADMPVFHIRETCLSNVKAKDGGLLEAPNGGTVRLKGNELSPKIVIF